MDTTSLQELSVRGVDTQTTETTPVRAAHLSVIVPCFNESKNVELMFEALKRALVGIDWEVIYVDDDSPDGTSARVRELAQKDARIRCIQRIGRRGLSTAVVEGILASSAPYCVVIDGDLQHDEKIIPQMLAAAKAKSLDVVIGSRHVEGGSIGAWSGERAFISQFATRLSRLISPAELADPMSGFFLVARPAFDQAVRKLSGQGFKILLDMFASSPRKLNFIELPYQFRNRQHGESKLDSFVAWEYLMLLMDKMTGGLIPARFILFALVGFSGVAVHLGILRMLLSSVDFYAAQGIATMFAMTTNFLLNNQFTYRDCRLTGRDLITGLLSFYAVCGIGAVANVGAAAMIFNQQYSWWLSGLAGAAVGVFWNYTISTAFTWKKRVKRVEESPVLNVSPAVETQQSHS